MNEWNLRNNIQSKELYNYSVGMKEHGKNSRIYIFAHENVTKRTEEVPLGLSKI